MKYIYRVETINIARITQNMGTTRNEYQLQVVEPSPSLHLLDCGISDTPAFTKLIGQSLIFFNRVVQLIPDNVNLNY